MERSWGKGEEGRRKRGKRGKRGREENQEKENGIDLYCSIFKMPVRTWDTQTRTPLRKIIFEEKKDLRNHIANYLVIAAAGAAYCGIRWKRKLPNLVCLFPPPPLFSRLDELQSRPNPTKIREISEKENKNKIKKAPYFAIDFFFSPLPS